MPRENKTKYALLGLLDRQPMSGYDIKKSIERSLGNFWNESYGQIYPVMRQLSEEGLATKIVEAQEGRPDRHVYAITFKGRQELKGWLNQPCDPHKERVEVLLKLFFGMRLTLDENIAHIERFRQEHTELLAKYLDIEKLLNTDFADHPEKPFWSLALNCGFKLSHAYIEWCEESIKALQEMDTTTGDDLPKPARKSQRKG